MLFNSFWRILHTTLFLFTMRPLLATNTTRVPSPDCDFDDSTLCYWKNDHISNAHIWIVRSGNTSSLLMGPRSDVSGYGMYATFPRFGYTARLVRPKMQGPKCLTVMYHMYYNLMGSLIIYLKTNHSETVQWIKAGYLDHPDQWLRAAIFVNSSVEYQVTCLSFFQD
ncbi:MAM and LDL-receptor class A domain-containing protein 1-like [Stylophora pistillata]|uniref:MAM and LDL-receptor class A domain-containing protein 1-like n=1 Tax=Stylophora pistillata TaxID=50429 RepID=UPI000C055DF6|nr:MAM and LDL-receptor class A domain-containing protein 1-like [Stylophora pistillata]